MILRTLTSALFLCFCGLPLSAQTDSEFLVFSELHIIETRVDRNQSHTLIEFLNIVSNEWTSRSYLNEVEGEHESRLYRNGSFLHKEALLQNHLGNSAILDDSLILVTENGVKLSVGMHTNTLKTYYRKSYARSENFQSDSSEKLSKIIIPGALYHRGKLIPSDNGGLTFIYNTNTGIVQRIYSSW